MSGLASLTAANIERQLASFAQGIRENDIGEQMRVIPALAWDASNRNAVPRNAKGIVSKEVDVSQD